MITGYNTDVKHEGTVFHVQTEDGGKDNPVIVSLIYQGGRILASKKTSYAQILGTEGFLPRLRQMLEDQHRAMIRAIVAGAVPTAAAAPKPAEPPAPAPPAAAPPAAQPPQAAPPSAAASKTQAPAGRPLRPPAPPPARPQSTVTEKNLDQVILEYLASEIEKE